MAECCDDDGQLSHHFSPLEEQYIREAEEDGEDMGVEVQIQREKEVASQKLWCAFQDSATAVAHLFRGSHLSPNTHLSLRLSHIIRSPNIYFYATPLAW